MPLKQLVQQDLSKGTDIVANPYDLSQQQSILVINLILDEHGSVRTRPGTVVESTAPQPGRRINRVFDFVKTDLSVRKTAILKGEGATNNELYLRSANPWTLIGAMGTQYEIPDTLSFTDRLLIVNGYEVPWQWDGTTFSHITSGADPVPPGAKHHALHLGSYWLWNTAAVTNTTDGPSSLRASDVNNPNSWPAANQVFVAKDDGQQGQGIGQFTIAESGISPTDTIIVFKDFSSYQVTAIFGAATFSIQKTKSDMGCVAPRSIQFVSRFGMLRLTHRGIALFDGVEDSLVSEEIRPLLFGGEGFTPIDWSNVGLAYAAQVQNPPLYLLFCPAGGPALTRVFCYDLVRQSWSILNYAVPFSSVQLISDPNTLPKVLAGDYAGNIVTTASVRELFRSDSLADDCIAPICWELFCKPVGGSSPQEPGYFRRAVVKVANVVAHQVVHALAILGPVAQTSDPRTVQRDLEVPVTVTFGPIGAGYGLDPYGTSPYGGAVGRASNSECDLTLDLGRIANNARLILTGCGPIIIRGVEWHLAQKPVRRASIYTP